jgi:hypothetical protein
MMTINWGRQFGGSSACRRKARRQLERAWKDEAQGRFNSGEVARVNCEEYGKRYKGTPVTITGKDDRPGYWVCQSNRRQSPLVIADKHLNKEPAAKAAA